jgi:hypothetical protein
MPRKVLVTNASDYESLDDPAEYYQAQGPYHFALSQLCHYVRETIDFKNNEDWPDGMLTKAVAVLSLCQVTHDRWQARRFDDALLVGDQARMLLEEITSQRAMDDHFDTEGWGNGHD